MRRLQSLKRRLIRWENEAGLSDRYYIQLWEEWMCIFRSPGFPGGFQSWITTHPEIAHVPLDLPTSEYVYVVEQLLKYEVDHLAAIQTKKHQQLAKFMRDRDVKKFGRAAAFKSVKEQGAGLLTHVTERRQIQVSCEAPPSFGLLTVRIPDGIQLGELTDITLDQHPVEVIQWQSPLLEVMLHDADVEYGPQVQLGFNHVTANPAEITQHLDQYWRTYWNRDLDALPEDWTTLDQMIDSLLPTDPIQDDFWCLEEWKAALRALKSKSARGCCAWAPDELKALPDICVQSLIDAFRALGTNGMQAAFMAARTVPIKKNADAQDATQTRPITVLSLLYRLWGRVVSQIVLRRWGNFFPKAIAGFLPHRPAVLPMYALQHQLETVRSQPDEALSGLTLDIRKCFNALPVQPAKKLLAKLGVPDQVIQFWHASIVSMQRVWQVNGQLFITGPQVTGVPEGDAMSVVVMLAYNYVWTKILEPSPIQASAYADNWSYAVRELTMHQVVLPLLLRFIQCMKLSVDWTKTWI